jgi:hypothetical protein
VLRERRAVRQRRLLCGRRCQRELLHRWIVHRERV